MSTSEGRMLGRYQLLFMLGQGGMGEVHLARLSGAAGFEKLCIVKTVLPNLMNDQSFIDRFHHEARVLVQLNHANIAQVYDMGDVDGTLYMAIEYVPGVDLARVETRVERQQAVMPVPIAIAIGQKIAEALGYAHRKVGPDGTPLGIVHRDVSPQNVMVSYEGEVKVIDFGLAKSTARSKHTLPATVMGKLGYMSPEQALAKPVDHRSDIFSAGIVVWEMLAGRSMYAGGTMSEMVAQMAMAEVPSLREVRPDISPTLEQIVMRALAKDPSARYQRGDDFARALNELAVHEQMTVGAEDVGNYVRAMCPEEFAAERQLQSKLSVLRKAGTGQHAEYVPREPEIEGTLVRPSSSINATPSGSVMTPAQRAMSMVQATPRPGSLGGQKPASGSVRAKSIAPEAEPEAAIVAPKSKLPLLIGGLVAFIALAGGALALIPSGEAKVEPPAKTPVAEAPIDAGAAVAVAEPVKEPVKEEPPKEEPAKVDYVVLETVKADGKVWKVLREDGASIILFDEKDRLLVGDRLHLLGEPGDDGKRPVYSHAAVLGINGSIAKLVFDEDVPLPEKLWASKDAEPKHVVVAKPKPRPTGTQASPEPTKTAEPAKTPEPTKLAEVTPPPEPVKTLEPVKPPPTAQAGIVGSVQVLARAVVLSNDNNFQLTNCQVRLPSNVYYQFGTKVVQPNSRYKVPLTDFLRDTRAPDPQFKANWAAIYCKEGTGYWYTKFGR